jgi:hypothetical protein
MESIKHTGYRPEGYITNEQQWNEIRHLFFEALR